MASSVPDDSDAGFATPAAVLMALALAIPAAALTASSLQALRLARSDYAASAADARLAGVQETAVLTLLSARQDARLTWLADTPEGSVNIIAEPQAEKVGLADADALDDATLRKLGVPDPRSLRDQLKAIDSAGASDFQVESAGTSTQWRACGRSLISPYGAARALGGARAMAPIATTGAVQWRVGQTWRLRATDAKGWTDDRVIRFTGEPGHPVAIVERRFNRTSSQANACEALFPSPPGASA